jgi:hypothetical protein
MKTTYFLYEKAARLLESLAAFLLQGDYCFTNSPAKPTTSPSKLVREPTARTFE